MRYLSYPTYKSLGGQLDEEAFAVSINYAESLLDVWTLNRLAGETFTLQAVMDGFAFTEDRGLSFPYEVTADGMNQTVPRSVQMAVTVITDNVPTIRQAFQATAEGQQLTSFSNGVTSLGFSASKSQGETAVQAVYDQVCLLLPIDYISACVYYNGAN